MWVLTAQPPVIENNTPGPGDTYNCIGDEIISRTLIRYTNELYNTEIKT